MGMTEEIKASWAADPLGKIALGLMTVALIWAGTTLSNLQVEMAVLRTELMSLHSVVEIGTRDRFTANDATNMREILQRDIQQANAIAERAVEWNRNLGERQRLFEAQVNHFIEEHETEDHPAPRVYPLP